MSKLMNKLAFGRTINDQCDNLPKGRSKCFDYGSLSGCDDGCPALWDGECDVIGDVLDDIDIDPDEALLLLETYKSQLTEEEYNIRVKEFRETNK